MIVNVFPIGYRHRPMSHQLSISTSKHSFDEIDVKTRFSQIIRRIYRIQHLHKIILKQRTRRQLF